MSRKGALRGKPNGNGVTKSVLVELVSDAIPVGFESYRWHKIVDSFYLLTLPLPELQSLATDPDVVFIESGHSVGATLDTSCSAVRATEVRQPANGGTGYDGTGVVVGIIDWAWTSGSTTFVARTATRALPSSGIRDSCRNPASVLRPSSSMGSSMTVR